MRDPEKLTVNATLILKAVIEAGGMAGQREIWNRANRNTHQLTLSQVQFLLPRMAERGHLVRQGSDPVMWVITATGRDWLKRQKKEKK